MVFVPDKASAFLRSGDSLGHRGQGKLGKGGVRRPGLSLVVLCSPASGSHVCPVPVTGSRTGPAQLALLGLRGLASRAWACEALPPSQ